MNFQIKFISIHLCSQTKRSSANQYHNWQTITTGAADYTCYTYICVYRDHVKYACIFSCHLKLCIVFGHAMLVLYNYPSQTDWHFYKNPKKKLLTNRLRKHYVIRLQILILIWLFVIRVVWVVVIESLSYYLHESSSELRLHLKQCAFFIWNTIILLNALSCKIFQLSANQAWSRTRSESFHFEKE